MLKEVVQTFFWIFNLLSFHQHIHLGYIFPRFFYIRHMQNQLHFCICRSLKLKHRNWNSFMLYVMMLITQFQEREYTPCLHLRNNTIQTYTPNRKNTYHCPLSQTHLFESKPNLESSRASTWLTVTMIYRYLQFKIIETDIRESIVPLWRQGIPTCSG